MSSDGWIAASTVACLAAAVPGAVVSGNGSVPVSGLACDSRLVQRGWCFVALTGAELDGHNYIEQAIALGASCLLVERTVDAPVPQIAVGNSRAALAKVATAFFGDPSGELGVIGVTGTDGKTTTSYLIDAMLRGAGHKTGMIGTVAIRIGDEEDVHSTRQTTPESVDIQRYLRRMVEGGVPWATLEATSHGLAMHRLDGVRFRIGAVTNITHEHLDYHGTIANYRRAKAILFERVHDAAGIAVINLDDPGSRDMLAWSNPERTLTYTMSDQAATLRATQIVSTGAGSQFLLHAGRYGSAPINLPMLGGFNIANALCAAGVALAAEVPLPTIATALASAVSAPGRMKLVAEGQPFAVIVDYAHTPDAMTKVLSLLRSLYPDGRLIVVFGSAGERDLEKRPIQGAVAARIADLSIVTSEDPRHEDPDAIIADIAAGALRAGAEPGVTLFQVTERRDALALAFSKAGPGDCVLLAGKGHEGSIIWGREKRPWDEEAVARALLRELVSG